MADDPLDYTARFNTKLDPDEEVRFQDWLRKNSKKVGRDLSADLADYDLRGQYKGTSGAMVEPGHGTDRWKKPNHPTFSDESVYHGKDGLVGGHWGEGTFNPGATNLQMRKPEQLQQYFREVEPDVNLILPNAQPAPAAPGKPGMTDSTPSSSSSSMAQLLALIQGNGQAAGGQGQMSPAMMQNRIMQMYPEGTPMGGQGAAGMPGFQMPPMQAPPVVQPQAGSGSATNFMALLSQMDPETRARIMGGQQFPGMNIPQGILNMRNMPSPNPNASYGPLGQSAGFMGIRAGMQQPEQPPVADMTFTQTPQNYDPNAARNQALLADRAYHNDQPLNRSYGDAARGGRNFGEATVDPYGSMDTERAIRGFAPRQQPTMQELMMLLSQGAGTST